MKAKKDDKAFYATFAIIVYALAFLLACHAGKAQASGGARNFLDALSIGAKNMFSKEVFSCFPIDPSSMTYVLAFSIIFALFFAYMIFDKQRNAHYKSGEESGTAKWNTDFVRYNKIFVDPIVKLKNGVPVVEDKKKKKSSKDAEKNEEDTLIDEINFDQIDTEEEFADGENKN